jgi:hypothetical protein
MFVVTFRKHFLDLLHIRSSIEGILDSAFRLRSNDQSADLQPRNEVELLEA